MRRVAPLLLSLSLYGCTRATDSDLRAACDRYTDVTCATAALDKADKQLAQTYQQVAAMQEDEGVKRLASTQRNWIKFRDSYAEFMSLRESDAQKARLVLINQKIDSDLRRAAELQQLVTAR